MRAHLQLLAVLGVCVAGCGAPRLDGSSDERMRESVSAVRESLPQGQRKEFDEAILVVAMRDIPPGRTLPKTITPESIAAQAKEKLSGKSADEVIAEATRLKGEMEAQVREDAARRRVNAREEATAEVRQLEVRRAAVEAAKRELAKFQILDSRFSLAAGPRASEPMIVLTVRNGTSYPVSGASFSGAVVSPGRSVPWLTEQFSYAIPGGLEPGEQATWRLAPNDPSSAWGTIRPPKDAALQVEVIALEGPDGNRLFTNLQFDDADAQRLAALKKQYGL